MRKAISCLILLILAMTISLAQLANSPWPMLGYDMQHSGRSPYDGPLANPVLKWTFTTKGYITSSPVIDTNGTIYVGSDDGKVYAINPDGTQKWAFKTGKEIYASPIIGADGTIYVGSLDYKFYAITPDGKQKWAFDAKHEVCSGSAISKDGTLYIGSFNGNVYAVNPDGTQKWESILGGNVTSSPVLSADGNTIYVGSTNYNVYALNLDGSQKWVYPTGLSIHRSIPSIGADGTIYVGSMNYCLLALNPDGTLKWKYNTNDQMEAGPSIAKDGTIYCGPRDGELYAINPNGTKKWSFKAGTMNSTVSFPAIGANGTIYIGCYDSKVYAVNPDGTQIWAFTTAGHMMESSPAIAADGTLYIGSTDNKLYAISGGGNTTISTIAITSPKGGEQWQQGTAHPITWTSTGNPGNVKIELFKGGLLNSAITATVANSGTFNWTIPAAQAIGTDYRVKISSVADATVTSQSAANFAINTGTVKSNDPWPIYHHDMQHTGRSTFNGPASPTVIWKYASGPFASSPVVKADGTIYVGNNTNLLALDATGNKKWAFKSNASVLASPGIGSNGTVYIGHQSLKFSALNPDGSIKWEFPAVAGVYSSPAFADDGTIYIGATIVSFYALNPDGTEKWKVNGGNFYSSPIVGSDGTVYYNTDTKLTAVTSAGVKKWEYTTGSRSYVPSLGADGTIYTGSDDFKLYAINPDGTKKWEFLTKDKLQTCPAIALDGTIYIVSIAGILYAVNNDGSKKWEFDIGVGGKGYCTSSPIIDAAGVIYAGSSNKNMYAINPDGTKKWEFATNDVINSDPVIAADGVLYIGSTDGVFYALGKAGNTTPNITVTAPNGGEQWQQGTAQNITWSSTGVTGNVKIELYKTGKVISTIAASVVNSGTYSWNIPATQAVGTDYRVKISSVAVATLTGQSAADFAITAGGTQTPAITVTAPNGGVQWQRGIAHTITWTSSGITGNVKIDLLKAGTQDSVIAASVANNGTYSWTIPATQVAATDYRVKVSSVTTVTVSDSSNADFAISATTTTIGVPVQLSPANNAINVNKPVTIAWQAVNTAVSYEYELYGPASATVAIETNIVTTTSATIQFDLVVGTKYSWRVRATNASDISSAYSSLWSFTVANQTTTQLDAPTLIAPADAAIDVPINTVFSWTAVANAKAYDVDVATTSDFSKKVTLSTTNTTLTAVLANNTVYYWRARAKQGNIISAWSTANTFTTIAFVPTSGLDAAIGNSKVGSIMMGNGVINNTGDLQTVQLDQQVNRQSEFYITIKNTGNVPDSFLISSTSTIGSKWRVNVFDISGINRTLKVFTGGWSSYSVKPGESVQIMLRFAALSGQVIDVANPPTQSVTITAQSLKDLYSGSTTPASDTVVGTVVLVKRTGL